MRLENRGLIPVFDARLGQNGYLRFASSVEASIAIPGFSFSSKNCGSMKRFGTILIAGGNVMVELKSAERLPAGHSKKLQAYLWLIGLKLGYLLNFGGALMNNGITWVVNDLEE